ncbi:MAG: cell division protein SepF [Methanotrichaceae archaeon]
MMAGLLEKLKFIGKSGEDSYTEIDLDQFVDARGSARIMLRLADLDKIETLPEIKQEIYAGNILLIDIAGMRRDMPALERAIAELKKATEEVSGDIVGIGDDLVAVVPEGIMIEREKIIGGKD